MRFKKRVNQDGKPPEFRRRGRILFALLGVLIFIGLVPLATVAWKLIDINREALTTAQQEYQLLLAASTAEQLDMQIQGLTSQLAREAQALASTVRRRGSINAREIRGLLDDVADERFLYLRYSYFRARDVEAISVGRLPEGLDPLFVQGLTDTSQSLTPEVPDGPALASLTEPVLIGDAPGRAVVIVSAPVVSGGKFRGVLSAMVDVQSVWEIVTASNYTGNVLYAIDGTGKVFASTDPVRTRPGRDYSSSPLVERFLADGRGRETMPFVDFENGTEHNYLASYEVTHQNWGIFVQARLKQAYLPVQAMVESTLTWVLAALGLALLVALFFARSLSNPINNLAAASRAFARGDFSARVQVRTANEIGELAHTFNKMAAEIEDYIRRLRKAFEDNNELFLGTIRALAQAIDAKDPYTRGHSVRVNRYSVIIARQLGLSKRDIRDIHVSSLLHDVGKIGIAEAVLNKPGKLTDEEYELMKTHPVLGANIMSPIRQMTRIIPGLRWHHERLGGTGYPEGLKGEQIPLMARIIAVADVFDAITTTRPYQKTMSFTEGLQLINRIKGSELDERVVEAFNRAYMQGQIRPDSDTTVEPPAEEPHADPLPVATEAG